MNLLFSGDFVPDKSLVTNEEYFIDLLKVLDEDTVHISNLECPLSSNKKKIFKTGPNLIADPSMIVCLKRAKVDYTCLANNHIKDYGSEGISDTIKICLDNKIGVVGAGITESSAREPIVIERDGFKIGILNYCEEEYNGKTETSYGANLIDEINIWYDMQGIRKKVDLIFVVMHWGKEMYQYPTPKQQNLAKYIIDLGADGIIGHHSHVMGAYEIYKGKPIIYSLGNFYFQENNPNKDWFKGVLCKINISDLSINLFPYEQNKKKLKVYPHIKLQESTGENCLVEVNNETVTKEWDKLLGNNLLVNISRLASENRIRKFFIQRALSTISKKEKKAIGYEKQVSL